MKRSEFDAKVIMAIEVEDVDGNRFWEHMTCKEANKYLKKLTERDDLFLSDFDFSGKQKDEECQKVLDRAHRLFKAGGFKNFNEALEKALAETEEKAEPKPKRVWTEDEIRVLIQQNDKVLYGALRKLYAEQTADEQRAGETKHNNGVGFNGADSKFLSSVAEFLNKRGFLTTKQKAVVRRKLVKYNRQLTRLANA